MSSINVSTVVFRKIRNVKKLWALFEQHRKKTVLPQGVGKTASYLGQDGPSSFFAPYISRTHNYHLFCGLQCWITYLPQWKCRGVVVSAPHSIQTYRTIIMIGSTRKIIIQPYCLLSMLLYSVHRITFQHALSPPMLEKTRTNFVTENHNASYRGLGQDRPGRSCPNPRRPSCLTCSLSKWGRRSI